MYPQKKINDSSNHNFNHKMYEMPQSQMEMSSVNNFSKLGSNTMQSKQQQMQMTSLPPNIYQSNVYSSMQMPGNCVSIPMPMPVPIYMHMPVPHQQHSMQIPMSQSSSRKNINSYQAQNVSSSIPFHMMNQRLVNGIPITNMNQYPMTQQMNCISQSQMMSMPQSMQMGSVNDEYYYDDPNYYMDQNSDNLIQIRTNTNSKKKKQIN